MKMVLFIEFETADSLLEIGFSMWGTPYASHTHMSLEIRKTLFDFAREYHMSLLAHAFI